jgi:hypothetical protein
VTISQKIRGYVILRWNGYALLVRYISFKADIKSQMLPITFHAEDAFSQIDRKRIYKIQINADSRLCHDLIEFGDLESADIFLIELHDGWAEWTTIPEEEWERQLNKKD